MRTATRPRCVGLMLTAGVAITVTGCSSSLDRPRLGALHDRAAGYHDQPRNQLIVIPGILGSKPVDGDSDGVAGSAFSEGNRSPKRRLALAW